MFQVLAHFHFGRSKTLLGLPLFLQQPLSFVFLVTLLSFLLVQPASAQILENGQLFTNGLSIIDAPAPQGTFQAGSNLNIAVEVSGDGKLPLSASVPGNSGDNGYDGLDLYLVSSQTNTNLTVSFNSTILKQESGSTVKHLDWPIPSCIAAGQYNLTFYECARINSQFFYTITPIGIQINNPNQSGDSGPCTSSANALQQQPQLSSPPLRSPFLPTVGQQSSAQPNNPSSSGFVTSRSNIPTPSSGIITITMSSGASMPTIFSPTGQTATVTQTANASTVTVVMVSMQTQTLTTTVQGQPSTITTTEKSSATTTAVMNGGSGNTSGFQPVNAAPLNHSLSFASLLALMITVVIFGIY